MGIKNIFNFRNKPKYTDEFKYKFVVYTMRKFNFGFIKTMHFEDRIKLQTLFYIVSLYLDFGIKFEYVNKCVYSVELAEIIDKIYKNDSEHYINLDIPDITFTTNTIKILQILVDNKIYFDINKSYNEIILKGLGLYCMKELNKNIDTAIMMTLSNFYSTKQIDKYVEDLNTKHLNDLLVIRLPKIEAEIEKIKQSD